MYTPTPFRREACRGNWISYLQPELSKPQGVFVSQKIAPSIFASLNVVFVRSAPVRFAFVRSAVENTAPVRSASVRFASSRSASVRSTPDKSHSVQWFNALNFKRFFLSVLCS